jgi:hypothetical protein
VNRRSFLGLLAKAAGVAVVAPVAKTYFFLGDPAAKYLADNPLFSGQFGTYSNTVFYDASAFETVRLWSRRLGEEVYRPSPLFDHGYGLIKVRTFEGEKRWAPAGAHGEKGEASILPYILPSKKALTAALVAGESSLPARLA